MTIRFDGRVAIVTGAGQGLGRSHALHLAERGARVVVNDLGGGVDGSGEDDGPAQSVVDEIRSGGGEAVVSFENVADPKGAERIVETALDTWGKLDILINNAGILRDRLFLKMDLEDFEAVIKVHLMGTVYVTKAAFPALRRNNYGRIVMTTSAAGLYGNLGQSNYAAAKLGVVGLMNSLKIEGQRRNILVNAISPVADTRMGADVFPDYFKQMIRPELVSAAVGYLASESCLSTGEILSAGAGYFARARIVETSGFTFPIDTEITPEMIAENFEAITDMTGAEPLENAFKALEKLHGKVAPQEGPD